MTPLTWKPFEETDRAYAEDIAVYTKGPDLSYRKQNIALGALASAVLVAFTGMLLFFAEGAFAAAPSVVSASNIGQMKQGARGDQVRYLQMMLAADPAVYPEGLITGYYGPLTTAAVKRYQKLHGFAQVGQVGPLTLAQLGVDLSATPLVVQAAALSNASANAQAASVQVNQGSTVCAYVPPGHLIAPGWLKHHPGQPVLSACQTLPPGIAEQLTPGTTTPDTFAPLLSSISANSIGSTSASISWLTNEYATSRVSYGTTTAYGLIASLDTSYTLVHTISLANLMASTTYHYAVTSSDLRGNTATSSDYTFTTGALPPPDQTAPLISGISVGSVSSTSAIVSWTTSELSTSRVYFGTTTPLVLSSAASASAVGYSIMHSLVLPNLMASSTYQYVIESKDAAGNTATSTLGNFLTPN